MTFFLAAYAAIVTVTGSGPHGSELLSGYLRTFHIQYATPQNGGDACLSCHALRRSRASRGFPKFSFEVMGRIHPFALTSATIARKGSQQIEGKRAKSLKFGSERPLPLFPTRHKYAIFPPIIRLNAENCSSCRFKSSAMAASSQERSAARRACRQNLGSRKKLRRSTS
jgi:hypothetical protein